MEGSEEGLFPTAFFWHASRILRHANWGAITVSQPIILYAEDDVDSGTMVAFFLNDASLTVDGPHRFCRGAIDALAERRPHAAVLDYQLLDGTSEALARKLAELHVPFVFLTGVTADELPTGIRPSGVLHKPFDIADLVRLLRELIPPASP